MQTAWMAFSSAISGLPPMAKTIPRSTKSPGPATLLSNSDVGKSIKVKGVLTDDAGYEETLTSAATAAVIAEPEPEPDSVEPPPTPQNLSAMLNDDGSITLTWDIPDDNSVTGYQILRRRPRTGEDTLFVYVENTGSTATAFTRWVWARGPNSPGLSHSPRRGIRVSEQ